MPPSDMTSAGESHYRQHLEETSAFLGRRGRWAYIALVPFSLALMAVMFLAYAQLWPGLG